VWPAILGVDSVALVIANGTEAVLASPDGLCPLDRALVRKAIGSSPLIMRSVARGHPFFGSQSSVIRAEAIVRIDCRDPERWGLLLLGQKAALPVDPRRGGELLQFLGGCLGAMIGRWTSLTND
jgi:hypothetical protein